MIAQSSNRILMIEPAAFMFNEQTALSNDFQKSSDLSIESQSKKAIEEHRAMVDTLRNAGINVWVVEDTPSPIKPDAIFPNNWLMMHHDGSIIIFPMKNENRRLEKRLDIIEELKTKYKVKRVLDYSHYESQDMAMEGTGSVVFDHIAKIAYACNSPRTEVKILNEICQTLGYEVEVFDSYDHKGKAIYHTNVVMCIGTGYVVIGLDSVTNQDQKNRLIDRFNKSGLEVISLTADQLNFQFAGNMLELLDHNNNLRLVMSQRAYNSLNQSQINQINQYAECLPVPIDIIETVGGGSARCMIAENFLEPKS